MTPEQQQLLLCMAQTLLFWLRASPDAVAQGYAKELKAAIALVQGRA